MESMMLNHSIFTKWLNQGLGLMGLNLIHLYEYLILKPDSTPKKIEGKA